MHHYIVCSHMLIYQASTPLRSNSCGIHMNQNNCSNDFLSEYHQLILPRPKTCRKKDTKCEKAGELLFFAEGTPSMTSAMIYVTQSCGVQQEQSHSPAVSSSFNELGFHRHRLCSSPL